MNYLNRSFLAYEFVKRIWEKDSFHKLQEYYQDHIKFCTIDGGSYKIFHNDLLDILSNAMDGNNPLKINNSMLKDYKKHKTLDSKGEGDRRSVI
jgi:hypothetical protein